MHDHELFWITGCCSRSWRLFNVNFTRRHERHMREHEGACTGFMHLVTQHHARRRALGYNCLLPLPFGAWNVRISQVRGSNWRRVVRDRSHFNLLLCRRILEGYICQHFRGVHFQGIRRPPNLKQSSVTMPFFFSFASFFFADRFAQAAGYSHPDYYFSTCLVTVISRSWPTSERHAKITSPCSG